MADGEAEKRFAQFSRMIGGGTPEPPVTYASYLDRVSVEYCRELAEKSLLLAITTVSGMIHNGAFIPDDSERGHALAEMLDVVRGAE
ncbi:MAG: hypothetical protein ACYCOR_10895 [Acidobacteriaceae bacterium]